jgi:hypothetical protein
MSADPLASMRCWALVVTLGGQEYEIPPLAAADWWPVLTGDVDVEDLLPADMSDLDDQLLDGTITGAEFNAAMIKVTEAAAGRPLRAALVLAAVAGQHWEIINGRLAQRGFRWDVMPLGAALDAIYALVTESMDEKDRDEFLKLLDPEAVKEAERARARAEFEKMAGAPPATGRSSAAPSGSTLPRTPPRPRSPRRPGRSAVPS